MSGFGFVGATMPRILILSVAPLEQQETAGRPNRSRSAHDDVTGPAWAAWAGVTAEPRARLCSAARALREREAFGERVREMQVLKCFGRFARAKTVRGSGSGPDKITTLCSVQ